MREFFKVMIADKEDLPHTDGTYFVCRAGFMSVMEFQAGHSDMTWLKEVRWYIFPSSAIDGTPGLKVRIMPSHLTKPGEAILVCHPDDANSLYIARWQNSMNDELLNTKNNGKT